MAEYLCECASTACLERIVLRFGEYDTIRETLTYFAVAPNYQHVVPEVERIVGKTDRYWIVEKIGAAAALAVAESTTSDSVAGGAPSLDDASGWSAVR